ncbi:helix-turn-helix transcriptional regulator [Streptomyces sp. NPDC002055]|uniref:helix-turn-helix domain-containing protein n=1 Tax=Streptomyces sp. NPDC002055 TaxID=3154534 RepID=UPI003318E9C2
MSVTVPSPWVCLMRLALELTRARKAAGLGQKAVVEATRVGLATLSRAENAERRPQYRTVITLLDHYGVTGERRARMIALWEGAKIERESQPEDAKLPRGYAAYILAEEAAEELGTWEAAYVPGLLQTKSYAHAVIDGGLPPAVPDDRDRRVETRIKRQRLLTKPGPLRLAAIMDEAVLRREVGGPAVMADQLQHLQAMAGQPHITLRVLPFTAGAHPGMRGPFTLLTFPDASDPEIAYIDGQANDLLSQDNLDRYSATFATLRRLALDPQDSLALIASVMHSFKEAA